MGWSYSKAWRCDFTQPYSVAYILVHNSKQLDLTRLLFLPEDIKRQERGKEVEDVCKEEILMFDPGIFLVKERTWVLKDGDKAGRTLVSRWVEELFELM